MIPRVVQMAAEVASTLTVPQLEDYGNIIVNGFKNSVLGDMTAGAVGSIDTLVTLSPGGGYTPGTYTDVYLGSSQGSFANGTVVINGAGNLSSITLTTGGQNYRVGEAISFSVPGGSLTPAQVVVDSVNIYTTRPAFKGWTNNYQEYYTQLQPNDYDVDPGDPTMFEYDVHSYTEATGPILSVGNLQAGAGYTPGTHLNVPTVGGSGTGATLDLVIGVGGVVASAVLNAAGSGYTVGDGLTVTTLGAGYGFNVSVLTITTVSPAGQPKWAQAPRRLINATVSPFVPPNTNQQAIQYSAILYPVSDNPLAPPVDTL